MLNNNTLELMESIGCYTIEIEMKFEWGYRKTLWVYFSDDDIEPYLILYINDDGGFTICSCLLAPSLVILVPRKIRSETHLQKVIGFVGANRG